MGKLSIFTVYCRYGHGRTSGQIGCGETTRAVRLHRSQKQETEREDSITYEHLEQFPYVMRQLARELDWDRVQALYCFHIGIPTFIVDDSIIAQWLPTTSLSGPQRWTDLEDFDTLYPHVVLFSLTQLNLLDAVEGCITGQPREQSQAVRVFHCGHLYSPRPGLDYHPEHHRFLSASVQCHPTGWSLQWLVHSLQTALL